MYINKNNAKYNRTTMGAVILNKKTTNISQNKSKIEQSGGQQMKRWKKRLQSKKVSEILRKNIQIARLNKKLTQKQLATQSGVDVKTVNMIEAEQQYLMIMK